jgi:hypothetical protein
VRTAHGLRKIAKQNRESGKEMEKNQNKKGEQPMDGMKNHKKVERTALGYS